jgi:cell division protein ZapA (FtsZ GTPase activity inhibitor)
VSTSEEVGKQSIAIKVLGREYRVKSEQEAEHLQTVASYVDSVLREVHATTSDTRDAAILAALNIASELLRIRKTHEVVSRARLEALIELVDSA